MVKAILDGRKTVTRRVMKPQPAGDGSKPEPLPTRPVYWNTWGDDCVYRQPYSPGDILYVRETWAKPYGGEYRYKAGYYEHDIVEADRGDVNVSSNLIRWKPSIHMPREAARIFLRVAGVKVERLKDITNEQAILEGIEPHEIMTNNAGTFVEYRIPGTRYVCTEAWGAFTHLWDSTIKPADLALYGWSANPWVWVIEFERITKEEAEHG